MYKNKMLAFNEHLSLNQKKIVAILCELSPQMIHACNIQDIAIMANTSPASITKLLNKTGFGGWKNFKVQVAVGTHYFHENKIKNFEDYLEINYGHLIDDFITSILENINDGGSIIFFAHSFSFNIANLFSNLMIRLGINSYAFEISDYENYIFSGKNINIFLSIRGNNSFWKSAINKAEKSTNLNAILSTSNKFTDERIKYSFIIEQNYKNKNQTDLTYYLPFIIWFELFLSKLNSKGFKRRIK